jgi:hypothetical protein
MLHCCPLASLPARLSASQAPTDLNKPFASQQQFSSSRDGKEKERRRSFIYLFYCSKKEETSVRALSSQLMSDKIH